MCAETTSGWMLDEGVSFTPTHNGTFLGREVAIQFPCLYYISHFGYGGN